MNIKKAPLLRLSKRDNISAKNAWIIRICGFLLAIILGALIFGLMGHNPFNAYGLILSGSLGKKTALRQTIKIAVPLLGTALAIAPCFMMRFWNIGAEGQITAGAIGATFFALTFGETMPSLPLLLIMGISGIICGALWAFLPAFFKAKWGTNETLFTLMMNYIVIGLVKWLQGGPWEGKPGSQIIPNFAPNAVLPKVFGIHIGWIIVIILVVLMFYYMYKSKQGYEVRVVGDSVRTAQYAGMNVVKITIRTMLISGGICGLVGFMVCSGANMTLYHSVADGVGFTAITVAWLGQLNPFAMIIISLLMAILEKGANTLQTELAVPASISDIIIGIFLLCMLAAEFFINYKVMVERKEGNN